MVRIIFNIMAGVVLLLGFSGSVRAQSQAPEPSSTSAQRAAPAAEQVPPATENKGKATNKLTIEVAGGDKNIAVENASVYLKFAEPRKIRKDRKYELNVKTNHDGTAHIPDPPTGKVLIQVVADGWKTYGKYYDLTEQGTVIKIHLDRPPKWY